MEPRLRQILRAERSALALCAAVGLVLSSLLSVAWVRSYYGLNRLRPTLITTFVVEEMGCSISTQYGRLSIYTKPICILEDPWGHQRTAIRTVFAFWGLDVSRLVSRWGESTPTGGFRSAYDDETIGLVIRIPYWMLLVSCLIPAMWWSIRKTRTIRRVRQAAARGCCARCGYDLRASTGRCPECGLSMVGGGGKYGDIGCPE